MIDSEFPTPFMIGFEGLEPDWAFLRDIRPAGIILFSRNVATTDQLLELCARIRELKPQPVIAMDLEGGRVNRLSEILGPFPAPDRLSTPETALRAGRVLGGALNAFGICLDFAPVVDLDYGNPDNGLDSRTLGRDADAVSRLASHFLRGLRSTGVEGCLKHFPGLGTTTGDSHLTLPTLALDERDWLTHEAKVYRNMAGPEFRDIPIMLAHCRVPFWDGQIASSSTHAVAWLRQQGYRGLILTDDLEMKAIDQNDIGSYARRSLEAGADAALICHDPQKTIDARAALHDAGFLESTKTRNLAEKLHRITHNPAFLDRWSIARVQRSWTSIQDETVA